MFIGQTPAEFPLVGVLAGNVFHRNPLFHKSVLKFLKKVIGADRVLHHLLIKNKDSENLSMLYPATGEVLRHDPFQRSLVPDILKTSSELLRESLEKINGLHIGQEPEPVSEPGLFVHVVDPAHRDVLELKSLEHMNAVVPVQDNEILVYDHRILEEGRAAKLQCQAIGNRSKEPLMGEYRGDRKNFQIQS
jgi:hypothetical protein